MKELFSLLLEWRYRRAERRYRRAWAAVRELAPGTRKSAMTRLSRAGRARYEVEEAIRLTRP